MMHTLSYSEIKRYANGYWLEIFEDFAPELCPAIHNCPNHVACPVHGGTDGFRLFKDFKETGGGICNTCGGFSDGFEILGWTRGWSIYEAFYTVAKYLGVLDEDESDHEDDTDEGIANKDIDTITEYNPAISIRKIYAQTMPADDTSAKPLRAYLTKRGLSGCLPYLPNTLRYHPALQYWHPGADGKLKPQGSYPAMVAVVHDIDGNVVSLTRTYLTRAGDKAPVPSPKKAMRAVRHGAMRGAAIRLYAHNDVLAVAEGIETSLAVSLATGLPTWATVSANGMQNLSVPNPVKTVYIMADLDRSGTGVEAAKGLAARLISEGRDAYIVVPPGSIPEAKKSLDWLDVYNSSEGCINV